MTDIEGVHDDAGGDPPAASGDRGLSPLLPQGARARRCCEEVKALADALGERRDRDVAIDALDGLRRGDAGSRPARDPLARRPLPRRAGAGERRPRPVRRGGAARGARASGCSASPPPPATRSPASTPISASRAGAERGGRRRGGRVKAKKVKRLDPATTLAENAARIVLVRLGELRSFVPEALDPDAVGGPARHADRRQAAALRARGDRLLLRPSGDHGAAGAPRSSRTCSARSTTPT